MHTGEFEPLRGVLAEADEPLTAREILASLEERGADHEEPAEAVERFDNPHRVATVLGRWAERGEVEVIGESPYRYRLTT